MDLEIQIERKKNMDLEIERESARSIGNRDSNFRELKSRVTVCFKIYYAR